MAMRHPAASFCAGRFCRGCGCTENNACVGQDERGRMITCAWVVFDLDGPTGFCSACAHQVGWAQSEILALAIFTAPARPQLVLP